MVKITAKELRLQPGKIIDRVVNGQEITVTFRGKPLVKIVPVHKNIPASENRETSIFGLWKDHKGAEDVENYVRGLRKGRRF